MSLAASASLYLLLHQPKPANTPTPPRPQGQPSPSIVVQQPPAVYGQTVCFPQMYPLTPVSPGVQVRDTHLHADMCRMKTDCFCSVQVTLSITLNQYETQSSLKQIPNNHHHEVSRHVCLCLSSFVIFLPFSVFDSSLMHAIIIFSIFLSYLILIGYVSHFLLYCFLCKPWYTEHPLSFLSSVIFQTLLFVWVIFAELFEKCLGKYLG